MAEGSMSPLILGGSGESKIVRLKEAIRLAELRYRTSGPKLTLSPISISKREYNRNYYTVNKSRILEAKKQREMKYRTER